MGGSAALVGAFESYYELFGVNLPFQIAANLRHSITTRVEASVNFIVLMETCPFIVRSPGPYVADDIYG